MVGGVGVLRRGAQVEGDEMRVRVRCETKWERNLIVTNYETV